MPLVYKHVLCDSGDCVSDTVVLAKAKPGPWRHAYWTHQKNVLLSMLRDDDEVNRKAIHQAAWLGLNKLFREFLPPKLNGECSNAARLTAINRGTQSRTTSHKSPFKWKTPAACHSALHQSNTLQLSGSRTLVPEQASEAAKLVYGMDVRDSGTQAVIKWRDFMPSFYIKQDFLLPCV